VEAVKKPSPQLPTRTGVRLTKDLSSNINIHQLQQQQQQQQATTTRVIL